MWPWWNMGMAVALLFFWPDTCWKNGWVRTSSTKAAPAPVTVVISQELAFFPVNMWHLKSFHVLWVKNPQKQQPAVFPESSELIIQISVVDFFTSAILFRIFYLFWGEITNYHLRMEAVEKMALWAKYRGKKYENAGLPWLELHSSV